MNKNTTVILLVLVSICGIFLFLDRSNPSTDERKEKDKNVFSFKADDVRRLEWAVAPGAALVLERDEEAKDRWHLREPLQARADAGEVGTLLSQLEFLRKDRTLEAPQSLAEYGLEPPRMRLEIKTGRGAFACRVGSENANQDKVYLQVEGESGVCLVEKGLLEAFRKTADQLRDRSLFTLDRWSLTRVEVQGTYPKVFTRQAQVPDWKLAQPLAAKANSTEVNTFLGDLYGVKIKDFVTETPQEPAAYGLAEATRTVMLSGRERQEKLLLALGRRLEQDILFGRLESGGPIFTVELELLGKLDRPANDYRLRQAWEEVVAEQAVFLEVTGPKSYQLKKEGENWFVLGKAGDQGPEKSLPEKKPADGELVKQLLVKLGALEVSKFVEDQAQDLEKYDLGEKAWHLTLATGGTPPAEKKLIVARELAVGWLRFVRPGEGHVFAAVTTDLTEWLGKDYLAPTAPTPVAPAVPGPLKAGELPEATPAGDG